MNALSPLPALPFKPYGLMSLLEMLEIFGHAFYDSISFINSLRTIVDFDDKKELDPAQIPQGLRPGIIGKLELLELSCAAFGASLAIKSIHRMQDSLREENYTYGQASADVRDIDKRIRDQLDDAKLFGLDSHECAFFNDSPSESVQEAFPRACFDLDEAGKCIALNRSTAAVLHLMRALEQPLQVMANALDVPSKENWNIILNAIENKIRGKDVGGDRTDFWKGKKVDQTFFAEAASHFFHIKNAWRNYSTHGVKEKYTMEEAIRIYYSVTAFFEHLSSRFCEDDESSKAS